MVKNFEKKYGRDGLQKICDLFTAGTSNQIIAKEFSVTRQRVHQWQKVFILNVTVLRPLVVEALSKSLKE